MVNISYKWGKVKKYQYFAHVVKMLKMPKVYTSG